MSDKLLNQDIDPAKGVKRLNAKPLYIVIAIGLVAFLILMTSILSKQKKAIEKEGATEDREEIEPDENVVNQIFQDAPVRNTGTRNTGTRNTGTRNTGTRSSEIPRSPRKADTNDNESELVKSLMLRIQDLEGTGGVTGGASSSRGARIPSEEELLIADSSMRISFSNKGTGSDGNSNGGNSQNTREEDPFIKQQRAEQERIQKEYEKTIKRAEEARLKSLGIPENRSDILLSDYTSPDSILNGAKRVNAAKQAYENRGEDGGVILPYKVQDPVTHLELKAGSIINATLVSGINTDVEGTTIAQISSNIFDSHSGQHLLIPQGTKLLGEYGSSQRFGDTRVGVTWNRLIFPDGKSLTLNSMAGGDTQGYSGLEDKVNNHYFKIYGGALALSGVSVGIATAGGANTNTVNTTTAQTAQQEVATNVGRLMTEQLQQSLNIEPTIIIRPGKRVALIVTQDLTFEEEHTDHLHFSGAHDASANYGANNKDSYFDPSSGVSRRSYKEYSK